MASLGTYMASLIGCALIAFLISAQLFRWDPEAKAPRRAKLWAISAIIPFLLLGAWETVQRELAQPCDEGFSIHPEPYSWNALTR